ncbi:hypothetical protein AGMMS49574_29370 [Bacteroidia bacterium]|nr:hypothetical protein AGMMS49574_29370 [Bacteroidia bacterium]GHU59487.1 hypothetical protein FACS189411_16360 [Bacteroidia bacterium]
MKNNLYRIRVIFFSFLLISESLAVHAKGRLPEDVLKQLNTYNVTWNTLSLNGSMGSMPLGNGDITANVWIEKGGDLMLYIGKSDTWSEATRLLKVGRVRISLSPNPFVEDTYFSQTLNLYEGEINVSAGTKGNETKLKIWIDANQSVVRVETDAKKNISISCTTELMRPKPYTLLSPDEPLASSFRGVVNAPVRPSESADVLVKKTDRIYWYHRNESSFYPTIFTKQNVPELLAKYPDPYLHRTFGAAILGTNMQPLNDSTLISAQAGKKFVLSIYPYTAQTETVAEWEAQLGSLISSISAGKVETARQQHYSWWDNFWDRSWIFISGDADAKNVTQAYLLQRFMMACQSRGTYPAKFNGGNFTFDYKGFNGDYRDWGPGYWHQNNRLFYMPLTASGDYDLLKPWFNIYKNMLGIQSDVTKKYYGHGGAFFPETFNFFGLFLQDDWGWDNVNGKASDQRWIRYHYSGALEVLTLMLEYYDYTKDEAFVKEYIVPFATQAIRFFDQHWPRISNTIRFVPANSIEQFWDCVNPVDYIAGLRYAIAKLNHLPEKFIEKQLLNEWNNCLKSLPPIPMTQDKQKVLPAEAYGQRRNNENPECYVIFPYKLYGIGHPDLIVAMNTFNDRLWKQTSCWSQCPIQAALLGLTDEAKNGILKNIASLEPDVRFPVFWKPFRDYVPDLDNGGVFTLALQHMILQNVDDKIYILPAFPKSWNVDFKMHAFGNTTVRVKSHGAKINQLDVYPLERKKDIIVGSM